MSKPIRKELLSISTLLKLPVEVPEIQRQVSQERVQQMIKYQCAHLSKFGCLFIVGDLVFLKRDEVYYILDGQHRYYTFKAMERFDPDAIVTITILDGNAYKEDIFEVFKKINESVPVPDYIILNDIRMKQFKEKVILFYKDYLTESNRPHPSNVFINVDHLCDKLIQSQFFKEFKNSDDVFEYFEFANLEFEKRLIPEIKSRFQKKINKGRKHLYIGFDKIRFNIEDEDLYRLYKMNKY